MKDANAHLKEMIGQLAFEVATLRAQKEELAAELVRVTRMLPQDKLEEFSRAIGAAVAPSDGEAAPQA